jgi:carboxypeptidase family protein
VRKFLALAVVAAVSVAGVPSTAQPAAAETARLVGTALNASLQPLPNATVQIRDLQTGGVVGSTTSGDKGQFTFIDLAPGTYIVEVVNAAGAVQGMTAPFRIGTAPLVSMSVVSVGQGLVESGGHAGFSLFGLGHVASLAVLGAAGAAGVAAVVATRPDASPSK